MRKNKWPPSSLVAILPGHLYFGKKLCPLKLSNSQALYWNLHSCVFFLKKKGSCFSLCLVYMHFLSGNKDDEIHVFLSCKMLFFFFLHHSFLLCFFKKGPMHKFTLWFHWKYSVWSLTHHHPLLKRSSFETCFSKTGFWKKAQPVCTGTLY